jgi:restriction system protein
MRGRKIDPRIPKARDLIVPVFEALKNLGGQGDNYEIYDSVINVLDLPDDVVNISHLGSETQTELMYQTAWAKTYLKKYGVINNETKSLWTIEPRFKKYSSEQIEVYIDQAENITKHISKNNDSEDVLSRLAQSILSFSNEGYLRLISVVLQKCEFFCSDFKEISSGKVFTGTASAAISDLFIFEIFLICIPDFGPVSSQQMAELEICLPKNTDRAVVFTRGSFDKGFEEKMYSLYHVKWVMVTPEKLAHLMYSCSIGITDFVAKVFNPEFAKAIENI